jgi:two-component system phosphate regulon sensor histidine kinase PhoR
MLFRFLVFLVFQLLGAGIGWLLDPRLDHVFFIGALIAAGLWFMWDAAQLRQLQHFLQSENPQIIRQRGGVWGYIAQRVERLLRIKDRAIEDAERRLHDFLAALQASPNGVVLLDEQSRIEWCNQIAAAHFGLDVRRDVLQTISNLVRDPGFNAYLSKRNFENELLIPGRNSTSSRPVKLSVQLYPYGGGRLLLLSRDVTALEQAEAMRRDFVANVSHEIRTPLTVLAGFVETMQSLELSESERTHYLDLMAQQSLRMQTLVSDLLTLSRLEASPAPGLDSWTSAAKLMQQLAQDAQALTQVISGAQKIQHDLHFDCQFEGQIGGIANELYSAMGNLVSNAIRYSAPGRRIDVSLKLLDDGRAVFSVADNGPGIAPEHLPRLTERFYRVDRSRSRETGGTGLGLAIVKHVTQRHAAELNIESVLGQGSQFKITLPAYRLKSA